MLDFARWKILLILFICGFFSYIFLFNLLDHKTQQTLPEWLQVETVNLGLDLRGGVHLLLDVDVDGYFTKQKEALRDDVRSALREAKIGYRNLRTSGDTVKFTVRSETITDQSVLGIIRQISNALEIEENGEDITVSYSENTYKQKLAELMEQTIQIIGRRVNELGTTEPIIQRQGSSRILVQVPGLEDPRQLKDILQKTASMTFHLLNENVSQMDIANHNMPFGTRLINGQENDTYPDGSIIKYPIKTKVELDGDLLTNAQATYQDGQPVVSFTFNNAGSQKFGKITKEHLGKRFAVVLDNQVITAPVMRVPILDGRGIIEGGFTVESANELAILLRAGALPTDITFAEERTVGPSLGSDSIAAGKMAAIIAIIAVMAFMLLSYGLFGVFSNISLLMNMALLMGGLSVLQATLTLPGIAGIVLTLGMAVDANVLIFERIREEIARGRTAFSAVETGFKAAFGTIIDSNLTTLIAAAVLFYFGTGTIKGFAVTLSIGILSSMFTAMMLTRMQVALWMRSKRPQVLPI